MSIILQCRSALARIRSLGCRLPSALALAAACACLAPAAQAAAADYPAKPVRIVVGFPPGGAADMLARLLAEKLGNVYKQSFVVENRAGAGGTIGAGSVARAPNDGYTLLLGVTASQTIAPFIYKSLPYDPVKDFEPVAMLATIPVALVVNDEVPAKSAAQLVALAKGANPPMGFGSSGIGAIPHLTGELFQKSQGLSLLHVPFKGSSPALTELLAGRVQMMFDHLPSSLPSIKAGKLRAIAIAGDKRAAALPEIPTLAEEGINGVAVRSWFGLLAPRGTPKDIVDGLNKTINEQLAAGDAAQAMAGFGAEPAAMSPEDFARIIREDSRQWEEVVRDTGVTAN